MAYRSGDNQGNRWKRLATFDSQVLQEVYRDTNATVPGILTVVAVMFASSFGGFIWALLEDVPGKGEFFVESVVLGTLIATGMFFVWAGFVALAAGQLGRPDNTALAATVRTLSFATVPFAFSSLIFIPGLEYTVTLISVGLLILSTTLATQAAVGGTIGRALGSNLVGFFLWVVVLSSVMSRDGNFAPGVFLWERFGL